MQALPGAGFQVDPLANVIEFTLSKPAADSPLHDKTSQQKPRRLPIGRNYENGTGGVSMWNKGMALNRPGRLSFLMCLRPGKGLLLAAILFFAVSGAWASSGNPAPPANLSATQIVAAMQVHNHLQNLELQHYQSLREYRVEYRGYNARITARMKVLFHYDATTGKSFQILSQSGSSFLCNEVLKRAVDSEEQASKEKGSTALTPDNYKFRLLGSDTVNGRPAYILDVTPVKPEKFLYKGKIWVDAADFALVKIEAAPAKNPSFWITHTSIWFRNAITDGFWLPQETRSETSVRIGGTAVLTIDYGPYQITPSAASPARSAQSQSPVAPAPAAQADPPARPPASPAVANR